MPFAHLCFTTQHPAIKTSNNAIKIERPGGTACHPPEPGHLYGRAVTPDLGSRRTACPVADRPLGVVMNSAHGPILRFDNLTLGYNRHPAVHHLRGEVAAGSLLAVVGPNGAGKSTLFKGIVAELRPMQGRVELIGLKRERIACLTQQSTLDGSFPIVIHDFVAMCSFPVQWELSIPDANCMRA